jgi:hypothetical protein
LLFGLPACTSHSEDEHLAKTQAAYTEGDSDPNGPCGVYCTTTPGGYNDCMQNTPRESWSDAQVQDWCGGLRDLCISACENPEVFAAGTGCDQGQCIWAKGLDFTGSCHVDFHQKDGTIYTWWDTNCGQDQVTAVIPPEVLGQYPETWISVVNSFGYWTPGFYVKLQ